MRLHRWLWQRLLLAIAVAWLGLGILSTVMLCGEAAHSCQEPGQILSMALGVSILLAPVGVWLATVVAIQRLCSGGEVELLVASGLSRWRLLRSTGALVFLLLAAALLFQEATLPKLR